MSDRIERMPLPDEGRVLTAAVMSVVIDDKLSDREKYEKIAVMVDATIRHMRDELNRYREAEIERIMLHPGPVFIVKNPEEPKP